MAGRSLTCPRCGGSMEDGFILDERHGKRAVSKWIRGLPERSIWLGLKLRGKEQLPVTTYRCRRCSYLENYAPG